MKLISDHKKTPVEYSKKIPEKHKIHSKAQKKQQITKDHSTLKN